MSGKGLEANKGGGRGKDSVFQKYETPRSLKEAVVKREFKPCEFDGEGLPQAFTMFYSDGSHVIFNPNLNLFRIRRGSATEHEESQASDISFSDWKEEMYQAMIEYGYGHLVPVQENASDFKNKSLIKIYPYKIIKKNSIPGPEGKDKN